MTQLTMAGVYHNGIVIPQEDVPYNSDLQVLITLTKEIPNWVAHFDKNLI